MPDEDDDIGVKRVSLFLQENNANKQNSTNR